MYYLGIDPGQNGGLVLLSSYRVLKSSKMPVTERGIWDWLSDRRIDVQVMGVIEKVHSMPGQGVSSTFKFGVNYGLLRMALVGQRISFEGVTPQTWQKRLGVPSRKPTESKTDFKNRLKALAQRLFPDEKVILATADALLLAYYCRKMFSSGQRVGNGRRSARRQLAS